MPTTELDRTLLAALVEAVHPADDEPGARETGVAARLLATLERERPEWTARTAAALAAVEQPFAGLDAAGRAVALEGLTGDADVRWLVELVHDVFYGEQAEPGGTTAGRRIARWPVVPVERTGHLDLPASATTSFDRLAEQYDVVVLGSGAGGGVAAQQLAASGRRVLLVERGHWPATDELRRDDLHSARAVTGLEPTTGPTGTDELRRIPDGDGGTRLVRPADGAWGNNAMTVGGGTRVYGAQAWRFTPADLTMATRYGVPEGSALADWPIGYDDLEPHYTWAEDELGVSGGEGDGDPWAGPRSRPLPMAEVARTVSGELLRRGAARLGWRTLPVPLLVNSVERRGRAGCVRCPQCVGFACPVDAKAGTHNTSVPAALATGRCTLVTGVVADRLLQRGGRITGVSLVRRDDRGLVRREVRAGQVVLACGAVETARLLLLSAHPDEPSGVGNAHDQVGRHLQGHLYAGATAVFDEEVVDLVGPGPSIATCDLRHGNPGLVGGGMLANEFVPTPASTFRSLASAGLVPLVGRPARDALRHWGRRMVRVVGPVQEVTSAESRVRLDPGLRDGHGRAGVRLSGSLHPEDVRTQAHLSGRAAEWLTASGAARVVAVPPVTLPHGPSSGQHQAGTCRMGTDPATSVVDPDGRVWGHDNLWVVDGSVHVTNGGVNPVLTILANAHRVSSRIPA